MKCKHCGRRYNPPKHAKVESEVCFSCSINKEIIEKCVSNVCYPGPLNARQSSAYWTGKLENILLNNK
jgi:hypothetical protein